MHYTIYYMILQYKHKCNAMQHIQFSIYIINFVSIFMWHNIITTINICCWLQVTVTSCFLWDFWANFTKGFQILVGLVAFCLILLYHKKCQFQLMYLLPSGFHVTAGWMQSCTHHHLWVWSHHWDLGLCFHSVFLVFRTNFRVLGIPTSLSPFWVIFTPRYSSVDAT